MFNLTSSARKSWQTVSRQADRVRNESTVANTVGRVPTIQELGAILRERREAMGASLAEVETATRIRQKYLAALESDEWHLLPGEIVGRGFLRNYATYLGLDATEIVERRRTVAEPGLSAALSNTSAGAPLPPERDIDYRPKDVSLRDEPEGIQQRELRMGPFFTVVALFGVLFLLWWSISSFGTQLSSGVGAVVAAMQTRSAQVRAAAVATPIADRNVEATTPAVDNSSPSVASDNNQPPVAAETPAPDPGNDSGAPTSPNRGLVLVPTFTPTPAQAESEQAEEPQVTAAPVEASQAETPTNTPEPTLAPTDTPLPLLTPTDTPLPPPTETPEPTPTEAPLVVAPFCPDERSMIVTPGVNQVVSGAISVTGRIVADNLDYYKLEYAVGAGATDGFVYFDGAKDQVDGGILGLLNTAALPNGDYTLRLTLVDLTGNYPPPCTVSITIQN